MSGLTTLDTKQANRIPASEYALPCCASFPAHLEDNVRDCEQDHAVIVENEGLQHQAACGRGATDAKDMIARLRHRQTLLGMQGRARVGHTLHWTPSRGISWHYPHPRQTSPSPHPSPIPWDCCLGHYPPLEEISVVVLPTVANMFSHDQGTNKRSATLTEGGGCYLWSGYLTPWLHRGASAPIMPLLHSTLDASPAPPPMHILWPVHVPCAS